MKVPDFIKPAILAGVRAIPPLERRLLPSAGYRLIEPVAGAKLVANANGWKSTRSAAWQQKAYDKLLADMELGHPRRDLLIAGQAVDAAGLQAPTLLEVGCGGGYHSAVFARLCSSAPLYCGSDYSEAMIESARRRFPSVEFEVADATNLPYADAAFDVVFEGVALMHIPDHRSAIQEIARVSRRYVIFHSTPVFDDHGTVSLFKYAYGQPVTETIFDRNELEAEFRAFGLEILESWDVLPYDVFHVVGAHSHSRTYLCRKQAAL